MPVRAPVTKPGTSVTVRHRAPSALWNAEREVRRTDREKERPRAGESGVGSNAGPICFVGSSFKQKFGDAAISLGKYQTHSCPFIPQASHDLSRGDLHQASWLRYIRTRWERDAHTRCGRVVARGHGIAQGLGSRLCWLLLPLPMTPHPRNPPPTLTTTLRPTAICLRPMSVRQARSTFPVSSLFSKKLVETWEWE